MARADSIKSNEKYCVCKNKMVQAIAAGAVKDLKEARRIVAASFDLKHYEPTSERAMWDEAYGRFSALS